MSENEDLHGVALAAARAGAEALLQARRSGFTTRTKTDRFNLVTSADEASETAILQLLQSTRPADHIVAEEGGSKVGTSGVTWYVDPLDGTTNYVHGRAEYAVSIAAYVAGEPVAAAICRPDTGAWLSTAGMNVVGSLDVGVRQCAGLDETLMSVGFPASDRGRAEAMMLLDELRPHVRDFRRVGSAACDLLAVATGSLDAYISVGLPVWDIAAGHLLVRRAGGSVATVHSDSGALLTIAGGSAVADLAAVVSRLTCAQPG